MDPLLQTIYVPLGLTMCVFYAIRAARIIDRVYAQAKAPWEEKWHQIWFNFAGSAVGWLTGYWVVERFMGPQNSNPVDVTDISLMVVASLGIVGYLPQTLNAIPGLLEHLSKLASDKLRGSQTATGRGCPACS